MSRESLVLLFGLVIFITPLMGVPPAWKEYFMLVIGVLLIIIGFSLRRSAYHHKIRRSNGEMATDSFVESSPEPVDEGAEFLEEDDELK